MIRTSCANFSQKYVNRKSYFYNLRHFPARNNGTHGLRRHYHFCNSNNMCRGRQDHIEYKSLSTSAIDNIWESGKGLLSLLTSQQRTLLEEQKQISKKALDLATKIGGVDLQHYNCAGATSNILQQMLTPNHDDGRKVKGGRSKEVLDSTFSVVIAGEFNAGKSTLINALLGQKLLETGALPTTDQITILAHKERENRGDNNKTEHEGDATTSTSSINTSTSTRTRTEYSHSNPVILHQISNLPLLQDLTLIDTPGTNAVINHHTERTLKLLPTADLILFVTSADRPFPESERQLLQSIQSFRKHIVIVLNKMDVLEDKGGDYGEEEKNKVTNFVRDNAADLLGSRAVVMPVSAKDALAAKLIHGSTSMSQRRNGDNDNHNSLHNIDTSKIWKRSNFATLESFLKDSLTEETKVQAKLLNPLGVTEGILKECAQVLNSRRKELETDAATMNLLRSQMESWKWDMDQDMQQFQLDVKDVLTKEMNRCQNFTDDIGFIEMYTLFLMGPSTSTNASTLEERWKDTKSITSIPNNVQEELLGITRECSDSVATSSRAQGQAVIEYLGKRPAVVGQNLIGSVTAASRFEETRKDLHEKMTQAVHSVFSSRHNEEEEEKNRFFRSMRNAVHVSSAVNTLALTLGASTAFEVVDVIPGAAGTCALTMLGVGIVPYLNGQAVKEYERRWRQRDGKLRTAFGSLCSKEIERIHQRILKGVAPYTRYVKSEEDAISKFQEQRGELSNSTQILRNRIMKLT